MLITNKSITYKMKLMKKINKKIWIKIMKINVRILNRY